MSQRRRATVAGQFYPGDPEALDRLVRRCLGGAPGQRQACRAMIVPHAALMYSGACAGAAFGRVAIPPVVVIVAPNHHGRGQSPAALWSAGEFETPLGPCRIDSTVAHAIGDACSLVWHDPAAHAQEHAIEVELPFLRVLAPATRIVPILLSFDRWDWCAQLARAIADVASASADPPLLIASSDMTHYERADVAMARDAQAFPAIEALDGQGLLAICEREKVTMCGRAAVAVVLEAARRLGATRATVVDHRHSGQVTGDDALVVSYASALVG